MKRGAQRAKSYPDSIGGGYFFWVYIYPQISAKFFHKLSQNFIGENSFHLWKFVDYFFCHPEGLTPRDLSVFPKDPRDLREPRDYSCIRG